MAALWHAWQAFVKGKRCSPAITAFWYNLEAELAKLAHELENHNYQHGPYESFIVHDPKKREIAVASVRDRVIHRLLYNYLVKQYDRSFCYDTWSCRSGKGLIGAISRTKGHMHKYLDGWLWRSDIKKFFDTVDHLALKKLLRRRIADPQAIWLLNEVINSYNFLQTTDNRQQDCQLAI